MKKLLLFLSFIFCINTFATTDYSTIDWKEQIIYPISLSEQVFNPNIVTNTEKEPYILFSSALSGENTLKILHFENETPFVSLNETILSEVLNPKLLFENGNLYYSFAANNQNSDKSIYYGYFPENSTPDLTRIAFDGTPFDEEYHCADFYLYQNEPLFSFSTFGSSASHIFYSKLMSNKSEMDISDSMLHWDIPIYSNIFIHNEKPVIFYMAFVTNFETSEETAEFKVIGLNETNEPVVMTIDSFDDAEILYSSLQTTTLNNNYYYLYIQKTTNSEQMVVNNVYVKKISNLDIATELFNEDDRLIYSTTNEIDFVDLAVSYDNVNDMDIYHIAVKENETVGNDKKYAIKYIMNNNDAFEHIKIITEYFTPIDVSKKISITLDNQKRPLIAYFKNDVELTKTGIYFATSPDYEPILSVIPNAEIIFSDTVVNQTSQKIITIANSGNGELLVNTPFFGDLVNFSVNDSDCVKNDANQIKLNRNQSCDVKLIFKPTQTGEIKTTLTINSPNSIANDNVVIDAKGNSLEESAEILKISKMNISFPSQKVNTTSAMFEVTLKNTSTVDIFDLSPFLSDKENFQLINNCYSTLPSGQSCTIEIYFTPKESKFLQSNIEIRYNSTLSKTITIEGTGLNDKEEKDEGGGCSLSLNGNANLSFVFLVILLLLSFKFKLKKIK